MPVTDVETILKDSDIIVSKTDLEGTITYVNDDFVRISGFSVDELIGSPQNIVRHPDMPREAFEDFWRTIKSGKAWTGLVKNRCKNGNHYWVEANAAPMLDHGRIVGYTSVRVKPSRQQVEAADRVYRDMQTGAGRFVIREGAAVRRSLFGGFNPLQALTIKAKILCSFAFLVAMFGIILLGLLANDRTLHLLAVAGAVLGLIVVAGFGVAEYYSVVLPVERARREADRMSAGDLSGSITSPGNDEISAVLQSLRILQINMKLLVGQIKEASEIVNSGASDIATGNSDLSARTESQASALEETASSMEELTGTVKQNAENAQQANALVVASSETVAQGACTMRQAVEMMRSIRESSHKMAEIINVIDGIAFQTNLLALNAAVEAARAGEHGRGFAAVAAEVRGLAQRSANAAREINGLIKDSADKVSSGTRAVDDAGRTMEDIASSVRRAAEIMAEIAAASREQSAGIEQVNEAVARMDLVTQQNAALVEEAAIAAEGMSAQALKLAQLISAFKLVSEGKSG
ncbi:methyl-accepting chemotaxis protein [Noviherbaspirillum cavernae]|nr:PAS domain-containing methyl-accepting chemotaxis protein [Noviherbaspirillum cavernae]